MSVSLGFGFWMTLLAGVYAAWNNIPLSLWRLDVSFSVTPTEVVIAIDPVFVGTGANLRTPFAAEFWGASWFGLILLDEARIRAGYAQKWPKPLPPLQQLKREILRHEYIHVLQCRALGPLFFLIPLIPNFDGAPEFSLEDIQRRNDTMWHPPSGLAWGSSLRISSRLGCNK